MSRRGTSQSHPKRGHPCRTWKPLGSRAWLWGTLSWLFCTQATRGLMGRSQRRLQLPPLPPQGLALPQPAGLRLPPLPRHCPTCLSGAASVSFPHSQVCPTTCPGAQELRRPVAPLFPLLETSTIFEPAPDPGPQPLGIPGSRGSRTSRLPRCGQSMDFGPQAV